jgi:hypothetical protein
VALAACNRERKIPVGVTEEDSPSLASVVHMGDPKLEKQLLKGFYNIESGAWRWSAGNFAVALRAPRNAAARGAVLHLKFAFPEAVQGKIGKFTLTGSVNGTALAPETYAAAGEYDYARDVEAKAFSGEAANVVFSMDNYLKAGVVEERELGLIVTSVGFEAK